MIKLGNTHINLLITIDKKYLAPTAVMLRSYIEHNKTETHLYVAHSSLSAEDIKLLTDVTENSCVTIHDHKITEHWFSNTPVLERLPEESFYRLLAFHYLPDDVEKCLYLDPDIIIRGSLDELYDSPMGNDYYIAACSHMQGFKNAVNKIRLGVSQKRYINSGIMLMNLKLIKKDFTLQIILDSLEENIQRLLLGDQDMANILFGEKILLLDERIYNLDERTYRYYAKKEDFGIADADKATIIHYNGKYKPWLMGYKGVLDIYYPKVENKGPAPKGTAAKHVRSFFSITKLKPRQAIVLCGALLFLLLCVFAYIFFGKEIMRIVSDPVVFRQWLDTFGPFDEIVFIIIRTLQTVIKFIPAEPLEIGSGYAWGIFAGAFYCVLGNMLGTLIILAIVKKFGKKAINFFIPMKNIDSLEIFKNSDRIYVLLFFLYLIPGAPKDGFTYFAGLLPIKTVPFLIVTFIARFPSVISSTWCGATLAEEQYLISVLIFAFTVVTAVLGGVIYAKWLKRSKVKENRT